MFQYGSPVSGRYSPVSDANIRSFDLYLKQIETFLLLANVSEYPAAVQTRADQYNLAVGSSTEYRKRILKIYSLAYVPI